MEDSLDTAVEYHVYFTNGIFLHASHLGRLAILRSYAIQFNLYAEEISKNYIWQKDPFRLIIGNDVEKPPHLFGKTKFADNIADEWLVVYILYKISEKFPEALIHTTDWCGDFIVIEAADYVPMKLQDPKLTLNRIFIAKGSLRFIPLSASPKRNMGIKESLLLYQSIDDTCTLAPLTWQQVIAQKMRPYDQRDFAEFHHKTRCYLPQKIAKILYHYPRLISHACHALCSRGMKPTDNLDVTAMFDTPTSNNEFVMTTVTMSRSSYMQFLSQDDIPYRCFFMPKIGDPMYAAYVMGKKIAIGFDILYRACLDDGEDGVLVNCLDDDVHWVAVKGELEKAGFFESGDKKYMEQRAKSMFSCFLNQQSTVDLEKHYIYTEDHGKMIRHALLQADSEGIICEDTEGTNFWLEEGYSTQGAEKLHKELYEMLEIDEKNHRSKGRQKGAQHGDDSESEKFSTDGSESEDEYDNDEFYGSFDDNDDNDDVSDLDTNESNSCSDNEVDDTSSFNLNDVESVNMKDEGISQRHSGNPPRASYIEESNVMSSKVPIKELKQMMTHFMSATSGLQGVEPLSSSCKKTNRESKVDNEMKTYMNQMDQDLIARGVLDGFEMNLQQKQSNTPTVDLKFNFVKNMLDSLEDMGTLAGPYATFLSELGLDLNGDENDQQQKRNPINE